MDFGGVFLITYIAITWNTYRIIEFQQFNHFKYSKWVNVVYRLHSGS